MRELSLFSGIGGGLLGSLMLGWHTVAAVDFEPYCCEVLARRKQDGIFKEPFDIYCMDIGEFNRRVASIYQGQVDIITGGFPCQPFSVAGQKRGSDDERNGFPVLAETIRIVRPRYLFLENVPALLNFGYFGEILSTLSESGYDVRWKVISAGELGAPHRRDRLWIMAYAKGERTMREPRNLCQEDGRQGQALQREFTGTSEVGYPKGTREHDPEFWESDFADASTDSRGKEEIPNPDIERCGRGGDMVGIGHSEDDKEQYPKAGEPFRQGWECESGKTGNDVSDTCNQGLERCQETRDFGNEGADTNEQLAGQGSVTWWDKDPADDPVAPMGRVAHGIPYRVDRLKGLGNGQVPYCMATAFRYLSRGIIDD